MKKFILSTLILFAAVNASAKNIDLVSIKSDIDPDICQIGLTTPNGMSISHVYFQDPSKPIFQFTMEELAKDKKTIVKKLVVPIIQLSVEKVKSQSFVLNVHYVYHYKTFGSERHVKQLGVKYVSPRDNFETIDLATKKPIKHAYAHVNMVDGKEVGIKYIETW